MPCATSYGEQLLPVIFDFTVPANKDVVETVTLLARMARFIIADLTDAAMVRSELMVIVPELPSVPVLPLLQGVAPELAEMQHLKQFRSMRQYTATVIFLICSHTYLTM